MCLSQIQRNFDVIHDAFNGDITKREIWDATCLGVRCSDCDASVKTGKSNIYYENLGDFTFLYLMRGDSLLYRGYTIGRGEGLANDSITLAISPHQNRGKNTAEFTQHGLRNNIQIKSITEFESEFICSGRFVRAVTDTIPNVHLIREKHNVKEYFANTDTIIGEYEIEFYRWFAKEDVIPFAIQFSLSGEGFSDSVLYLSEDEFIIEDPVKDTDIATVLASAEVSVSGRTITITIDTEIEFEFDTWLVDTTGHSFGHSRHSTKNTDNTVSVSVSDLPRGTYMLVISTDYGSFITEKRMLTL